MGIWIRFHRSARIVASLLAVALALHASPVRACSIDGMPSLSANGALADLAAVRPFGQDLAVWAPFVLQAATPGALLRLREDLGNLKRSLPARALTAPFRWDFGDGAETAGFATTHRYARAGSYRIVVSYREPRSARWIVFDSARIGIVPPGNLFRANLPSTIHRYTQDALRIAVWAGACALLISAAMPRLRRARHPAV